jgi:hypothetical protein
MTSRFEIEDHQTPLPSLKFARETENLGLSHREPQQGALDHRRPSSRRDDSDDHGIMLTPHASPASEL